MAQTARAQHVSPDRFGRINPTLIAGRCELAPQPGIVYAASGRTTDLPVTFAKVEKGADGKYHLGAAVDVGAAYLMFDGRGTVEPDGAVEVTTHAFGGAYLGLGPRDDGRALVGSVTLGVLVGIDTRALSIGYDFVGNSLVFGLATKTNVLSFLPNTGARICLERSITVAAPVAPPIP